MGGGFTVRRWRARWCMHPTHLASPASARLGCSIFLKLSTGPHCGVPFPELGRLRGACGGSFGLRKQRGPRLRLPIYPGCPGSVCLGGGIFKVWCLTRWARWGPPVVSSTVYWHADQPCQELRTSKAVLHCKDCYAIILTWRAGGLSLL